MSRPRSHAVTSSKGLVSTLQSPEMAGKSEYFQVPDGNGLEIRYQTHGTGPEKILLVMGLAANLEAWVSQIRYFGLHRERRSQYEILVWDNPGSGESTPLPIHQCTTSRLAKEAWGLVDHLGWGKKVHVVGVSLGGMIAQEMALARPEQVSSLALINTHAGGLGSIPPLKGLALTTASLLLPFPSIQLQAMLHHTYGQGIYDHPILSSKYYRYHLYRMKNTPRSPLRGVLGQMIACFRHRVRVPALQTIAREGIRPLVVVSTEDAMVRASNSKAIASVLQSPLVTLHHCGHGVISESGPAINEALHAHIAREPIDDQRLHFRHVKGELSQWEEGSSTAEFPSLRTAIQGRLLIFLILAVVAGVVVRSMMA